jgi:hypothetical protein
MKKASVIILHILAYPALLGVVLYFDWNIIVTQTKNYGVYVFVGVIVTALMALIYYICYAAITSKKKKRRKSVFNQTMRLCMVVVFTMTGLWCVCDLALPDFLSDATSSTIYYEDLADDWAERADVNADLLNDFIELSVKAGTLPYDAKTMSEAQAIEYYQSKGINETIPELQGNEYYTTINGLMAIQYQSINANGYQTFTHPWIDFATGGRLTIPCIVHLLLDKKEIDQEAIKDYDYTKYTENADGTKEVTSVMFVVYDDATKTITLKNVNWTVLDMLGSDNVIDIGDMIPSDYKGVVSFGSVLINNILGIVTDALGGEDILGSKINVIATLGGEEKVYTITLRPSNESRGVLGYQYMAWLDSNGLVYALVTLFSCRKAFLIFAAWGVVINLLIGCARGMCREEKEKRKRAARVPAARVKVPATPYYGKA